MERTDTEGNLYTVYKPARKTRKERNEDLDQHLHPDLLANDRVSIVRYKRDNFKRGLLRHRGEQPFPVQPKIGPYEIPDAMFGSKNYYWCSCGMSNKQPFCDGSHAGTNFKPLKFSLDEKSKKMHMCGCKLSSNAPFCDGETCKKLMNGERITVAEAHMIDEGESDLDNDDEYFAAASETKTKN